MRPIEEFRPYYNHTIYPELMRLESQRKKLLWLMSITILMAIGVIIFQAMTGIFFITLFLLIPIGFYISYLLYRIRKFKTEWKPKVVNLIIDFIDDKLSYGEMSYDAKGFVAKQKFVASGLFAKTGKFYKGEDKIAGKIGDVDFEMSELEISDLSKIESGTIEIFRGIFLAAQIVNPIRGTIMVLPRNHKQFLIKTIKTFNIAGGELVTDVLEHDGFNQNYLTYATEDALIHNVLSFEMQEAIIEYTERAMKDLYVSFNNNNIYLAVREPKDILEPFIFESNVDFELIREFFEDIQILLSIVEDFDAHH